MECYNNALETHSLDHPEAPFQAIYPQRKKDENEDFSEDREKMDSFA